MKEVKLNHKEMTKYFNDLAGCTRKCKHCGHSIQFLSKKDRLICSWCKNWIYKDNKSEFKYKIEGVKHEIERR
jgi:hypothetical protein